MSTECHAYFNDGCLGCCRRQVSSLAELLVACRDWFESPGGEPDSGVILERINTALDGVDPAPTPGHVGWHKWKNGAELVWVCSRHCPHSSHEDEP